MNFKFNKFYNKNNCNLLFIYRILVNSRVKLNLFKERTYTYYELKHNKMNHDFSDEIDLNLIDESDEESYINNNERATINYNQLAQLKKPINFLPNSHLAQTNFVFNQNMTLKSVNLIRITFFIVSFLFFKISNYF